MKISLHSRRGVSTFLTLSAVLLITAGLRADDPELEFRTLRTAHFDISFDKRLSGFAAEVATIAEESHRTLVATFRWEVIGRTRIHLEDSQDSANGWATASPAPLITLYATGPELDSSLQYHDNWLRTLFVHEYTHVIHLQMQHGFSRVVNSVFGDIYLLNGMQPRWFIEGLSVLMETEKTTKGRIRSSYYSMIMRAHALDGVLQTLDEASNSTVAYPRGTADYAYGAMFMAWLHDRFGMEKLVKICHRYASAPLPFGVNRVFQEVLGKDLGTLYAQWHEETVKDAQEAKQKWLEGGGMSGTKLTDTGETKGRPVFSRDGSQIYIPLNDGTDQPGIFAVNASGKGKTRRLCQTSGNVHLSIAADGRLFFTRSAPYKDVYRFADLFSLDGRGGEPVRLTEGMRVREAAVSAAGDRVVAVLNRDGRTSLALLDDAGRFVREVASSEADVQYYTPSFSPDGRAIAVVIRRAEQVDLFSIDLESGARRAVTDDHAIESTPVFSSDGNWLLYGSDRSGQSNIHAFHLADGRSRQITNALTGAVSPAVSPDGSTLAYLYYSAKGWDLYTMPFSPELASDSGPSAFSPDPMAPVPAPLVQNTLPYNPLPSFLPKAWRLGFTSSGGVNVLQISLGMADTTAQHQMNVTFNWDFNHNDPSVGVGYAYSGMVPTFYLNYAFSALTRDSGYVVGGETMPWTQYTTQGNAGLSVPIPGLDRNHALSFSYTLSYARPETDEEVHVDPDEGMPDVPTEYFRAGLRFGWSFSDLWSSPFGISTEKGRSLAASAAIYNPAFGGNQSLASFNWGWNEYLRMPWHRHHVVALAYGGGAYVSNPPHQASYSAGGYPPSDVVGSLLNSTAEGLPRLRGYTWNSLEGDHFQSLRFEYRLPIWWVERTYQTLPVFFRYLSGAVFSDNMLIAYDPFTSDDIYCSVGAELVWAFALGYYIPVTLRVGYARGLMEEGGNEFILVIGGTY